MSNLRPTDPPTHSDNIIIDPHSFRGLIVIGYFLVGVLVVCCSALCCCCDMVRSAVHAFDEADKERKNMMNTTPLLAQTVVERSGGIHHTVVHNH